MPEWGSGAFPLGCREQPHESIPTHVAEGGIALLLRVETNSDWGITSQLSPSDYESYFRQVRSALPELDKKLIIGIAVRHPSQLFANLLCSTRSEQDISDALVCDANRV